MLAKNLKHLRKIHDLSQAELAEKLGIPRTTLSAYERGFVEPNIELMLKMCKFFKVTVDDLIAYSIEVTNPDYYKNDDLRILAISVDQDNNSNIELVETKAAAGYLDSFTDPEFIKELPKIYFPNIPQGTYRGFQIKGDSMLPMESGTIIISSYVERINDIKDDRTYIIVSKTEGVVYKRVKNMKKEKSLLLVSNNEIYEPYTLPYGEIGEIWQYYAHLGFSDSKLSSSNAMEDQLNDIQKKVTAIYGNMIS